jgi:acyl-coenzyme A thioesterase PaaI-like protein
VSPLADIVRAAKVSGNFTAVVEAIPYLRFLGITVESIGGELVGKMAYSPPLVGNANIPALHGGAIGGLLESTAIFQTLFEAETLVLPKIVTITVDFLRSARPVDTFAKGTITRQGRRVVNVGVEAWQEDRARPVARANAIFLVQPVEE